MIRSLCAGLLVLAGFVSQQQASSPALAHTEVVVANDAVPATANCGDSRCEPPEDCHSCSQDCGSCCGDHQCAPPEDCHSCPQDCGGCH